MKTYLQFDANNIVVGVVRTDGEINDPSCVEGDAGNIGKKWDGAAFVEGRTNREIRKDEKRAALAAVDAKTGMPRMLRETLKAMAGAAAPQSLVDAETEAATLRAELAAIV